MTRDLSRLYSSAFVLRIRPGMADEYRRRHAAIWPELVAALRETGVVHYDIYLDATGHRAFGHMLRTASRDAAQPEHPEVLRWRAYMADVLEMDGELPQREPIEHVFQMTS
ncbi:MAG TPA: L-rhamnose mutarotase [Devosiaceae bacterium]|jgi:L-rhamnose mutarotase|nr:L-rhamnose mutarotase [Devosiaceae bacterium]